MSLKHLVYYWINVYEVTRHYGGPEGGGWWYDRMHCLSSARTTRRRAEEKRERFERTFQSANLGSNITALVEDHRSQSHTREAPEYERSSST